MSGTIAITMAGAGSRFVQAGYTRPKYEVVVGGRPLFDWSMLALEAFTRAGWRLSFAARAGQDAPEFLAARCAALGIKLDTIVELDGVTDGQATTALILANQAPSDEPFLVFNIDTFVAPGAMAPDQIAAEASGWVPCFPGIGDAWSFVRADPQGAVVELREKVRISDHATLGLYWFRSAGTYRRVYESFFADGAGLEKGERYIAPMYNALLAEGQLITFSSIARDQVGLLGTPEQVKDFADNPPAAALAYTLS